LSYQKRIKTFVRFIPVFAILSTGCVRQSQTATGVAANIQNPTNGITNQYTGLDSSQLAPTNATLQDNVSPDFRQIATATPVQSNNPSTGQTTINNNGDLSIKPVAETGTINSSTIPPAPEIRIPPTGSPAITNTNAPVIANSGGAGTPTAPTASAGSNWAVAGGIAAANLFGGPVLGALTTGAVIYSRSQ